ncbi:MAG: hypothetical protein VX252_00230, partial [Myxococcota bacterium]|nr:hypothetical protein [Myxococcota bacterium]
MTRNLSDVLDYFLPPKKTSKAAATAEARAPQTPTQREPREKKKPRRDFPKHEGEEPLQLLPILALPMGDRDVVRAAFTWNLAVEIARLGGRARVVTPAL